jgi:hypothetical protein
MEGHTYASQVVTEVDRKAQDAILETLSPSCDEHDFALLTEESEDDHSRFEKNIFGVSIPWMAPCLSLEKNRVIRFPSLWLQEMVRLKLEWSMTQCMIYFGRQPKDMV